jgi:hypothetical protein
LAQLLAQRFRAEIPLKPDARDEACFPMQASHAGFTPETCLKFGNRAANEEITLTGHETIPSARRSGRETNARYQAFPTVRVCGSVKMIEAVTAVLGLFSAGIFVAHALEAYRAH